VRTQHHVSLHLHEHPQHLDLVALEPSALQIIRSVLMHNEPADREFIQLSHALFVHHLKTQVGDSERLDLQVAELSHAFYLTLLHLDPVPGPEQRFNVSARCRFHELHLSGRRGHLCHQNPIHKKVKRGVLHLTEVNRRAVLPKHEVKTFIEVVHLESLLLSFQSCSNPSFENLEHIASNQLSVSLDLLWELVFLFNLLVCDLDIYVRTDGVLNGQIWVKQDSIGLLCFENSGNVLLDLVVKFVGFEIAEQRSHSIGSLLKHQTECK